MYQLTCNIVVKLNMIKINQIKYFIKHTLEDKQLVLKVFFLSYLIIGIQQDLPVLTNSLNPNQNT